MLYARRAPSFPLFVRATRALQGKIEPGEAALAEFMDWHGWTTLGVVVATSAALVSTRLAPDLILAGAVTALLTAGILEPKEALAGFANEGMVTVATLFVVAAALRETGGLDLLTKPFLGRPRSILEAQTRLMLPVTFVSAFLNNTPIVAMMMPVVIDWAKKHRLSSSKLLIPLSYATILGGTCSLIGTSTNLVVYGLMRSTDAKLELGLFDIAKVGIPCAVVGLAYVLLFGRKLLPDRKPVMSQLLDPREYTVEMIVDPASGLVGRTIEEAGLRHLSGMYLMEIHRAGRLLAAVSPTEHLEGGDQIVFVGVVESVIDLQRIRGLHPATDQVFKLETPRADRCLVEAVVSNTCPLAGLTIREGRFRTRYNAAVIAVAHNGERVRRKVGDITLQSGDTLLLEAHPSFVEQHRNSRDFYLVSAVEGSSPPRHDKAWLSIAILGAMVLAAATGVLSMLNASLLAIGLFIATGCIGIAAARRSVDWEVLLVIAASFGLSRALELSGAASWMARSILDVCGNHAGVMLAAIYGITMILNGFMNNNAAAALLFPVAVEASRHLEVSMMPFAIGIMMAGSNDFATPIGYQTNLMVYGPGGYRFSDYLRLGGPLNLLLWGVTVVLIPVFWPF